MASTESDRAAATGATRGDPTEGGELSDRVAQPPTLAVGQRGPWVRTLQTLLTGLGDVLACDGIFGPRTRGAVVRYQRANELDADGVVGPLTWGRLLGIAFGAPGQGGVAATPRGPDGISAGVGDISAGLGPTAGDTSAGVVPAVGGDVAAGPGLAVGAGNAQVGPAPAVGGSLSLVGATMQPGFVGDAGGSGGTSAGGSSAGGGASGATTSLAELGVLVGPAIESLLTLAIQASGLPWAAFLARLSQLVQGPSLTAVGRIAIVLIQVGLEVGAEGPYGPAWRDAAAEGILPPLPTPAQQQAARIEFFAAFQRWGEAFAILDGMAMLDIVDVLRVVSPATRAALDANFAAGTEGLDGPRLRAAFDTAPGKHGGPGTLGAMPAGMPVEEAAVLTGYSNLRSWPAMLPVAGRSKAQQIKTHGVKPPPGKPQVEVPDIGQSVATLPPDQQAMVELIARHRERLPSRAAELIPHQNNKGYQYNSHPSGLTPKGLQGPPTARTPGISAQRQREIDTAIWTEFQDEGGVGAINTYDGQIVTWGHGLGANNGVLRSTMPRLFALAPDVRDLLLDAGFTFGGAGAVASGGKPPAADWLWVNTATGRIETGADALEMLRLDTQMLTLLMNIAEDRVPGTQGTQFGQAFEDATQQSIVNHEAGKVPPTLAGLPDIVLRYCAHCIWGGASTFWKHFEAGVTTVASAARNHATRVGEQHLDGLKVTGVWGVAMRTFADKAVMKEGTLLPELPTTGSFPGVVWLVAGKSALQLSP